MALEQSMKGAAELRLELGMHSRPRDGEFHPWQRPLYN
jgi:hypothetical protein